MRSVLFGRSEKPEEAPATVSKPDGKGRPTPTRKEAEAAAKERARAATDKKAAQKLMRDRRADANRQMREGMKAGEEKFLPKRDQGPVRRFIRDWVDSRLTFTEFLLPMLLIIFFIPLLGGGGQDSTAAKVSSRLMSASILLLLVDVLYTRFRLGKALRAKFPDEDTRGSTFYAFIRLLQLRPMRLPKPQVKVGQRPG